MPFPSRDRILVCRTHSAPILYPRAVTHSHRAAIWPKTTLINFRRSKLPEIPEAGAIASTEPCCGRHERRFRQKPSQRLGYQIRTTALSSLESVGYHNIPDCVCGSNLDEKNLRWALKAKEMELRRLEHHCAMWKARNSPVVAANELGIHPVLNETRILLRRILVGFVCLFIILMIVIGFNVVYVFTS